MSELEKVIRPIVEGQLRCFAKEHPEILEAVNWYKPRADKEMTFVNSVAKRIIRDLMCEENAARIKAAALECKLGRQQTDGVEVVPAPAKALSGPATGQSLLSFLKVWKPFQ